MPRKVGSARRPPPQGGGPGQRRLFRHRSRVGTAFARRCATGILDLTRRLDSLVQHLRVHLGGRGARPALRRRRRRCGVERCRGAGDGERLRIRTCWSITRHHPPAVYRPNRPGGFRKVMAVNTTET
ncbi:hypothetical protein ACPA9J_34730 [Pseudomonas aeruginosa]